MKETKRQKLTRLLESIGWSLGDHGCNHYYIYDHNQNCTGYFLYGEVDTRVAHYLKDSLGGVTFYLKDCVIEYVGDKKDTVVVRPKKNKSVFIMFNNFKK